MRLGVKFSRHGMARFVSHLDMQRMFSRAIRRSGIPAAFTQGFNPHITLSFASAMPVGLETEGDYLEFGLGAEIAPEECQSRLAAAVPQGIGIVKAGLLPEGERKLMAALRWAEYSFSDKKQEDVLLRQIYAIMEMESCTALKTRKGKSREIDIRPLIRSVQAEDGLRLVLALSGEQSLSPKLLLEKLSQLSGEAFSPDITRTELYTEREGRLLPLEGLFQAL